MHITRKTVRKEHEHIRNDAIQYVQLINDSRDVLGGYFDEEVGHVTTGQFEAVVDDLFEDGDRAVNVAGLCHILRHLDVSEDYPGFIVDEVLGRKLAATIAGGEPLATLAEATFHVVDILHDDPEDTAGRDDLDAGIAAGCQTVLPGWEWRTTSSPFDS